MKGGTLDLTAEAQRTQRVEAKILRVLSVSAVDPCFKIE
jgi:hypothetical protein